jgi:hypothetical protein
MSNETNVPRPGMEFWDKLNALPRFAFFLSPSGNSVQKFEDKALGNWIDVHEAQKVVDQSQEEINQFRAERDALQLRLNAADQRIDELTAPAGYCLMPTRLTAENGAKALLLGEFKLEVTSECPECRDLDEPSEGCEICDGEGEYGQQHMIPWDQIKFIYSEAVKGLAKKPNTPQ